MTFQKFKLNNGLNCLLIPNKSNVDLFSIEIFVRVGSRDEDDITRGISHLLEHLLFKGTKKRKSYKEIKTEFDLYGGHYNASTSKNMTCYYLTAPTKYISKCLNLLSDILFNSVLKQKDIDKEKPVVIEELYKMLDNPTYALILAISSCFKGHPLEYLIIGTEDHINKFDRKIIYKYYKKYYKPSNMFLSICGNYPKNIKEIIQKNFNKKCKNNVYLNPVPKTKLQAQNEPRINVLKMKKEQTTISIVFPTYNL